MKQQGMFKRYTLLSIFVLPIILQGCLTPNQRAEDSFWNKRLPRILERLANQFHELAPYHRRVIERQQADANKNGIVRVAVIDNGVDLAHPDLVDRIIFEIKEGKIVGSGYDPMGSDKTASSNRIDPMLFAFGAEQIRDGKIVNPHENPLELLARLNHQIVTDLQKAIALDPILSKSLFTKLNTTNTTAIGLLSQLDSFAVVVSSEAKEAKDLVSQSNREEMVRKNYELTVRVVDLPWALEAKTGYPIALGSLSSIEHGQRFAELALEVLGDKNSAMLELKRSTESFGDYLKARGSIDRNELAIKSTNVHEHLLKALLFKIKGYRSADSLSEIIEGLQKFAFVERSVKQKYEVLTEAQLRAETKLMANRVLEITEALFQMSEADAVSDAKKRQTLEALKERKAAVSEMLQFAVREYLGELSEAELKNSNLRRQLIRSLHPYIASSSATTSHGTHVSGIVAKQNENIRIVPVRVPTDGTALPEAAKAEVLKTVSAQFEAWLAEPAVLRGVQALAGDTLTDVNFSDLTEAGRKAAAQKIFANLQKNLEVAVGTQPLDFIFVEDIKRSVEYIGQQKIKVANVSLGLNFNQKVSVFTPTSQAAVSESFDFLKMEFFKYQVAKTMERHAANTLFVIATGNDGAWIDGNSKSGIPFDLSSPFFEEHQGRDPKDVLPNNRIKNILAVGSINSKGNLSSFTNIPIGSQVPVVFAEGEAILSPIRQLDSQGVKQFWTREMPVNGTLRALFMRRLKDDEYKKMGYDFTDLSADARMRAQLDVSIEMMSLGKTFGHLDTYQISRLAAQYPTYRARLAGTSMATPAVAGMIASDISTQAQKMGINADALYSHPDFQPEVIIERTLQKAQRLNPNSRGISLYKLVGDLKYEDASKTQKLERTILDMRERAAKQPQMPKAFDLSGENKKASSKAIGLSCKTLYRAG